MEDQMLIAKYRLRKLIRAAEFFTSGDVVDKTSATEPLMEQLKKQILESEKFLMEAD